MARGRILNGLRNRVGISRKIMVADHRLAARECVSDLAVHESIQARGSSRVKGVGQGVRVFIWFILMLIGYTFIYSGLSYMKAPWIAVPAKSTAA